MSGENVLGVDVARGEGVDADLGLAELASHAATHLKDGRLGGVIRDPGVILRTMDVISSDRDGIMNRVDDAPCW